MELQGQAHPAAPGAEAADGDAAVAQWLAASRDRVPGFAARHFTWPGTLWLHRHALGRDILRAPANVVLSLVLVLARLLAWILRRLRLRGAAGWLAGRRILLRTSVAARVEALVAADLLRLPASCLTHPDGIAQAILDTPHLVERLSHGAGPETAAAGAQRIARTLGEYSGTRSAMAEVTVALLTMVIGGLAFRVVTPGLVSLAPGVAGAIAETTAIAGFPLGSTLGGVWYAVFPPAIPTGWIIAAILAMVAVGALAGAFAGILADPVQVRLGIHQRRLLRLIDAIEADLGRDPGRLYAPRDHVLARVFDLWDAALGLVRLLRG